MYLSGIEHHSDEAVANDVRAALAGAGELRGSDIEVTCDRATVTLRGSVFSDEARALAEQIAFEVRGAMDVVNRLRVVARPAEEAPSEPPPAAEPSDEEPPRLQ